MSLRIPLSPDQTLQTEFHEIERRLRRLERGVLSPVRSTMALQLVGGNGGTTQPPQDLTPIYDRLTALETALADLTDPEVGTIAVFGGVGAGSSQGLVPDPGTSEPPTGVGEHVLAEDATWSFPARGLVRVATSGEDTERPGDVLDVQAALHLAGDLSVGEATVGTLNMMGYLKLPGGVFATCEDDLSAAGLI